jgi:cytoskeleton protein RodZ
LVFAIRRQPADERSELIAFMTNLTQLNLESESQDKRRIHLREISGESDRPLETVGQDLRAARLRKGDDLTSVSRALKIRKDHIEAIEEDNLAGLPGKTYAVGFVRSYSAYLGLNAAQTVERFKAEISGRAEEGITPVTVIDEGDDRRLPQGWRIIVGVVVIALGYGGYHLLTADRAVTNTPVPPLPVQYVPHPAAPPVASPQPQAAVQAAKAPAAPATPAMAGQAAAAPAATPAKAPAKPDGTAAVSPAAPAQVPQQNAAAAKEGHVYGEQNKNARVVLRARAATHVLVRGTNGTVYINRTLEPGDVYQLPNVVGLTLATTNAGAVEVDLDGLAMGKAGSDLQTLGGLSLDPQAIVDRYNSHGG